MKYLILHADDFGMSPIFNQEILKLVKDGFISSLSIMVTRGLENQQKDITHLKDSIVDKDISIGIHVEFEKGNNEYNLMLNNQLQSFKKIWGHPPQGIDVHNTPSDPECTRICIEHANRLNIPLRNRFGQEQANKHTDGERYVAYGKSEQEIEKRLSELQDNKSYELVFHPGIYDPNCISSWNEDRIKDIEMIYFVNKLMDKYGIKKISLNDLPSTL